MWKELLPDELRALFDSRSGSRRSGKEVGIMTAMQRAECRYLKWEVDSDLVKHGSSLIVAEDEMVRTAMVQFYRMEGFEVSVSEDQRSFTVQPKPPVQF